MKFKNRNLFRVQYLILCAFFYLLPFSASASELSSIENKKLINLEKVFLESGPGLDFTVVGKSLLVNQTRQKVSEDQLDISSPVKKAFLIWSGEVNAQNKNSDKIQFLTADNKEHWIAAQRLWKKNSTGILYAALAEVTSLVTGSGVYGVKNLASDAVNPSGRDPYSVAGWALVVLTENRKDDKKYSVIFLAGLQVLKPGEIYDFPITPHLSKDLLKPSAIGIIGGHGREGNGSGNLINDTAISGKDDWNGSAGKFWDIDLFPLNLDTKSMGSKGEMALTIDPLLQWLYPIGVIIKS